MTYDDAVAYLDEAKRFGIHPSLEGIRQLCLVLGNPQDRIPAIQVAGTNGKGSTARMVAALLHSHGMSTGLFSSPRLQLHTEQYEIDGVRVDERTFAEAAEVVHDAAVVAHASLAEDLTEFELMTALAFVLFERARVDVMVLEVGLGGRWDATSVVAPAVSVLTSLGLDHCEQLGDTLDAIAAEKVQIARSERPVIVGPGFASGLGVLREHLGGSTDRVTLVGNAADGFPEPVTFSIEPPARGVAGMRFSVVGRRAEYAGLQVSGPAYQAVNAALAVATAEEFVAGPLEIEAVRAALSRVTFPGRFELFRAQGIPVVVDGAHNPHAAAALAEAVAGFFGEARPTLVLGMLADKDARGVLEALAPAVGDIICTRPQSPRGLAAEELTTVCRSLCGDRCTLAETVSDAVEHALRAGADGILIAGSLVTAAEARSLLTTPK